MAKTHGNEGTVKLTTNQVSETQGWTYEEGDVDVQEPASMGDTEVTVKASGIKAGGGTVECLWDASDTNGQEAMTVGASVTLNLYPEGDVSADVYYGGTAIITSLSRGSNVRGMVTVAFTFRGVLARAVVV